MSVLKDASLWLGEIDLAPDTSEAKLPWKREVKERLVFGSDGYKEKRAGAKEGSPEYTLIAPSSDIERAVAALDDGQPRPGAFTLTRPAAIGDVAYMYQAIEASREIDAKIGEFAELRLSLSTTGVSPRGQVLDRDTLQAAGVTTSAQTLTLPAVSAEQRVYLAFFVLSLTGSVTLRAQSNDGTWLTRFAPPSFAAPGSAWATVAGPITDTTWRVERDLQGAGAAADIAVAVAVS